MAMNWLEGELRKNLVPGDLQRAEKIKKILADRGEDVPLGGYKKHSPHGKEGRRRWIQETRENGDVAIVPEVLYVSEMRALSYAEEVRTGNPENPFFPSSELVNSFKGEHHNSAVYRIIGRLNSWGYLSSKWDEVASEIGTDIAKRRLIAITDAGSKRVI